MPRIPEATEFTRLWSGVSAVDRRRILRAVNRGQQVESRREAALAVVIARRQQRFWRVAWVLGPVISIIVSWVVDLGGGLPQFIANALLGAAVLIGMSVWFIRRAREAERRNTEHAVHGVKRPKDE